MQDLLIIIVILALFFDFTNGFHDTANAIATSVATKALKPKVAVLLAAVLNFLGAFVSLHVAATIAKGLVDATAITLPTVFAGITAAIIWNLLTWRIGMPTSSSHALVGGIVGATIISGGFGAVHWLGIAEKVLVPSVVAPILGVALASLVMLIIIRVVTRSKAKKSQNVFRRMQIVSASLVAFTHGTNDAQKTMGIIALALVTVHPTNDFSVPLWVIISAASAMALGTYVGGWKIIRTLGSKIVDLKPREGFAAETSTAIILWTTAQFGFPVSTTHTISSAIVGSGLVENRRGVNFGVIKSILLAWLITLPCAALVGATVRGLIFIPGGQYIAFALVAVFAWTALWTQHWDRETWRLFRRQVEKASKKSKKI